MRAGTLDDPSPVKPDVHIHTAARQPWVLLDEATPRFEGFYAGRDIAGIFGEANALRWRKVLGR